MTLAQLVYYARHKLDLTQQQAAVRCGISKQYLSDIENGRRCPKDEDRLLIMCHVLEMNVDAVFFTVGLLPPDISHKHASSDQVKAAFAALRKVLES